MLTKSSGFLFVVLALLLLAIVSLRFNRVETFPGVYRQQIADSPDSKNYVNMVVYFRGDHSVLPDAPFTYRPLLPLLAAFLPIENPKTALNFLNTICLLLALFLLMDSLRAQAFSLSQQAMAGLLFVMAFPTWYYATIGYVDPGLIASVAVFNRLLLAQYWRLALLVFFVGFFVRETMLFALPFAVMLIFEKKGKLQALLLMMVGVLLAFIAIKITRLFSVNPSVFSWPIDMQMLINNLIRPKVYLAFILTLGLPGLLTIIFTVLLMKRTSLSEVLVGESAYFVGLLSWCALFVVAMLTAYADGRFIWPSVLYSIPLGLNLWRRLSLVFPRLKFDAKI